MHEETKKPVTAGTKDNKIPKRREALLTTGKFAVYAAPFTLMALTRKTDGASDHHHPERRF